MGLSLDVFQLGPGFGALRALPIPTLPYQWPVTEMEVAPLRVHGVGRLGSRLVTPDALEFHIVGVLGNLVISKGRDLRWKPFSSSPSYQTSMYI